VPVMVPVASLAMPAPLFSAEEKRKDVMSFSLLCGSVGLGHPKKVNPIIMRNIAVMLRFMLFLHQTSSTV
jgi:hypothetical protein